jgi:hypothetical protein
MLLSCLKNFKALNKKSYSLKILFLLTKFAVLFYYTLKTIIFLIIFMNNILKNIFNTLFIYILFLKLFYCFYIIFSKK